MASMLWRMKNVIEKLSTGKERRNIRGRKETSDLISRTQAIYVASGYCHPANIATELAKLPTVFPDIIHCEDCKHYIRHDKRCGYWNHGVKPTMWCSQAERLLIGERNDKCRQV